MNFIETFKKERVRHEMCGELGIPNDHEDIYIDLCTKLIEGLHGLSRLEIICIKEKLIHNKSDKDIAADNDVNYYSIPSTYRNACKKINEKFKYMGDQDDTGKKS